MKFIDLRFFLAFFLMHLTVFSQQQNGRDIWLKPAEFNIQSFKSPALQYAPFTRWWWPGNDVTKEEIKRELGLFEKNNIGGVEIQPFALVFPTKGTGRADRIMSYDTPSYYDNLKFTLEEAYKKGITVDLTDGSGWPPGGPHIKKEDNNLTLQYGIADIAENSNSPIAVPRALRGDDDTARLVALLAVKIAQDTTAVNNTFIVDAKSITNITSRIKDNKFLYPTKGKSWKAIALWSVPTKETPMIIAKRDAGFVFNHFDSTKVKKNYDYLFGPRTGLDSYYGKSLRAIFDDSYEFKASRHFSDDFISEFKKRRNYDITSYLLANMWYGYNNMYDRMAKPGMKPDFKLSSEDWRLRYDYDLTLSDLLGDNFLRAAENWTNSRGMLHRTQPYGLNMDIIASAGLASIPEVETMLFSKGSENGYKLITSGAHLYNRPLISSETAVYINRAYMTTPQKIKMTVDKLLSSGVNQVIYHGTPYSYFPEGYPKEGWFPFYNSALGINFSSNLNENNPFWPYLKTISQYIQRAQYILQSGHSNADVLLYYPFLNYSEESFNPKEVLISGYMKETEPPLPAENKNIPYNRIEDTQWLEKIIPLIDELNARGITWDWINDASIQEMRLSASKKLTLRGNEYKSIVLFDLPYIQLKSAENLNKISKEGGAILSIGKLGDIQPSYYKYKENDKKTQKAMKAVVSGKSSEYISNLAQLDQWASKLEIPIKYVAKNENLRQTRRKLSDDCYSQFIWNESNTWQDISIKADQHINYYWLNAEDGSTVKGELVNGTYQYKLAPYSSIFLLSSNVPQEAEKKPKVRFDPAISQELLDLRKWDIKSADISENQSVLFDWKSAPKWKFKGTAEYTSNFVLSKKQTSSQYFLDMGTVYYAADVELNGKQVGTSLYPPFVLDITSLVKEGDNVLKIKITNAQYNEFVGQGENGERVFKKLKGAETMSAGLVGPVKIYEQK